MTPEAWSATITGVGVMVAVSALIIESRRARFTHSIEIITQLDSRFETPEFRETRRRAAAHLLASDPSDRAGYEAVRVVLNFFETAAFLWRRKAVPADAIWHYFGSWLLPFWVASASRIADARQDDPNCYADLDLLRDAVAKVERKKLGRAQLGLASKQAVQEFLKEEASLPPLPKGSSAPPV